MPERFRSATGPGTDPGSSYWVPGVAPASGYWVEGTLHAGFHAEASPRGVIYMIWDSPRMTKDHLAYIGAAVKETFSERFRAHLTNNPSEPRHKLARLLQAAWDQWPTWAVQLWRPDTLAAALGHKGKLSVESVEQAAQRILKPWLYGAKGDEELARRYPNYTPPLKELRRRRSS